MSVSSYCRSISGVSSGCCFLRREEEEEKKSGDGDEEDQDQTEDREHLLISVQFIPARALCQLLRMVHEGFTTIEYHQSD